MVIYFLFTVFKHIQSGGLNLGYDVHHIDENKLNNALSNLDYTMTHKEHSRFTHTGIPCSEEKKKKIADAQKGKSRKQHTEESKRKMSESHKNKKLTEESKKKISGALTGIKRDHHTEEWKQRNSEIFKGLFWWNNGKANKRAKECPGDDFVKGRLKK